MDNVVLTEIRTPNEYPEGLDRDRLAAFLHEALKPYEDTQEDIRRGIDDAIARADGRAGFVLLARARGELVGALVMVPTGMKGYVPANMLLFVAVAPSARGQGVGGCLVRRGIELTDGDMKLHVEYDNPAKRLYERLGLKSAYAEMRYVKE